MHQGQCGHRSTANMPQFQQEGRTSFSGGGRIATQTVLGRVHLNALALGKTYRCQAALLKINDPPPANLLASPLQMHRQHDQTRAKERNNPECGAFFQTGHPQHGCAAKQTRQRSRQDDFASGSSRLQLFGQPYPWLHGQHPGPHRQGGGPDRKAGCWRCQGASFGGTDRSASTAGGSGGLSTRTKTRCMTNPATTKSAETPNAIQVPGSCHMVRVRDQAVGAGVRATMRFRTSFMVSGGLAAVGWQPRRLARRALTMTAVGRWSQPGGGAACGAGPAQTAQNRPPSRP